MTVSDVQFSRLESQVDRIDDEIDEAKAKALDAKGQINMHEAVCAERYKQIQTSIEDVKYGQIRMTKQFDERMRVRDTVQALTLLAILFGPGAAAEFVKKFLGM